MSSLATCLTSNPKLECGLPGEFTPDGDIAGRGVFIAFTVAVFFTFVGVVVVLVFEGFEYFGAKKSHGYMLRIRMAADSYLQSFSDTQAITTLALLITVKYKVGCTISAYHYNLVCTLVLMSSAAYVSSMAVMHRYFDTNWILSLLRVGMILTNAWFATELVFARKAIFPSFRPHSNIQGVNGSFNTGLVLPAACFVNHPGVSNTSNTHNFTASLAWTRNATSPTFFNASSLYAHANASIPSTNTSIMLAFTPFSSDDDTSSTGDKAFLCCLGVAVIIACLTSILLACCRTKTSDAGHKTAFVVRCLSTFVAYMSALYGFARFQQLQHWMNYSGWFKDENEMEIDSFGQMMPLVLLALPFLALVEQLGGGKSSPQKNNDGETGFLSSWHRMVDR